jgi:hypothetical protein
VDVGLGLSVHCASGHPVACLFCRCLDIDNMVRVYDVLRLNTTRNNGPVHSAGTVFDLIRSSDTSVTQPRVNQEYAL